ncbi:MAG: capsule assembly Wzi family protein [Bacteroidales bacterium]|nr:capsule assembly Wzi family protein [Bacteroidales bacterium]MDD4670892.1 capsule assembly Wzi family protein [Bacteroidales bacterium]
MEKIKIIISMLLLAVVCPAFGQYRPHFAASLSGYVGSGDTLSFWAVTNRHGIVPVSNGGLLTLAINSGGMNSFKQGKSDFGWAYGASFAGQLYSEKGSVSGDAATTIRAKALIDQLYVSGSWKKLRLDLGMRYCGTGSDRTMDENGDYIGDFNGVGVSNGSVIMSGNSRNFPGYGISLDPVAVPWTAHKLWVWGSFGDYMMLDNRYVAHAMLHNQAFYLKFNITKRLDITAGFDHWAMWGGTNPDGTLNPNGFGNYIRILLCKQGGDDAKLGDQANVLGDHKGRTLARLTYTADNYKISLSKDSPYEDASGIRWQNFPDGVWSLYFGHNDKNRWVSDVIYEYIYTKWQSGSAHDRPATEEEKAKQDPSDLHYGIIILGGCDSYFGHSTYRSGWTNYGQIMGLPLISLDNNRLTGHHFGIKGKIAKVAPYRLMVTYTRNYGKYRQTNKKFDSAPRQLSFGLDGELPQWGRVPFVVTYGFYFDKGQLYRDNISCSVGVKFLTL